MKVISVISHNKKKKKMNVSGKSCSHVIFVDTKTGAIFGHFKDMSSLFITLKKLYECKAIS